MKSDSISLNFYVYLMHVLKERKIVKNPHQILCICVLSYLCKIFQMLPLYLSLERDTRRLSLLRGSGEGNGLGLGLLSGQMFKFRMKKKDYYFYKCRRDDGLFQRFFYFNSVRHVFPIFIILTIQKCQKKSKKQQKQNKKKVEKRSAHSTYPRIRSWIWTWLCIWDGICANMAQAANNNKQMVNTQTLEKNG